MWLDLTVKNHSTKSELKKNMVFHLKFWNYCNHGIWIILALFCNNWQYFDFEKYYYCLQSKTSSTTKQRKAKQKMIIEQLRVSSLIFWQKNNMKILTHLIQQIIQQQKWPKSLPKEHLLKSIFRKENHLNFRSDFVECIVNVKSSHTRFRKCRKCIKSGLVWTAIERP